MNYMNVHDHDEFDPENPLNKPDVPEDVQEAIRTLIRWTGDDPTREGLLDTPKRVGRAWLEYCAGNMEDPAIHLSRIFDWFEEDFETRGGVLAFVRRYAPEADAAWLREQGDRLRIRYLDYDWGLNAL